MEETKQVQRSGKIWIAILVAVVLIAIFIYWDLHRAQKAIAPTSETAVPGTANQPTQSLGGTLYNKASNPVSGALPPTVAPVPNPVQGLYKNPF